VSKHSSNLALQLVPASVSPRRGAEMSAILCRLALNGQAAGVARKLGRSEDLVRGWARGDSSPSLVQILDAPAAFASRLLASAGRLYAPSFVTLPIRDRLWLCGVALGNCYTIIGNRDLQDLSDDEIEQLRRRNASVRAESERIEADLDREMLRRRTVEAPNEKGAQ
jgi:hypothetical protein